MERIFRVLTRKKGLDPITASDSRLARVLNVYDLTALGVGSTLGVGVYVLAGQVAKETAGPSVILSFLIAAIASVFAGLCYAEFGARVPRAGSAYIYSYVTVGEFIAFIIGWNLILEYVIGSASVARGLSHYLDTLINNTLEDSFREIAPINISFMSPYFDFFSFGISVILATALAFGMKESTRVNNVVTVLNVAVILFVIIAGSVKANPTNWNLPPPSNSSLGVGGFFPFGVSGMIKGAATCFYGFVGFDCIATTGEEVQNPQKAIPISIMTSLTIVFLAYFGTATVVTLMVPYYLQDAAAPIPHAFDVMDWEIAKWIVSIGAMFGLCASLFGAMFPLPRIIYAMASDGVIFKFLGWVNERFRTPLIGTLLAGLLTGLMSALFDLGQLVNMMSIGTLLAYTIVAVCVLSLRYSNNEEMGNVINSDSSIELIDTEEKVTFSTTFKQVFNYRKLPNPTRVSQFIVNLAISFYVLLCLALGLCVTYLFDNLKHAEVWAIVLVSSIGLLMILLVMSIATQPISRCQLRFTVPFVPFIPALSILINIYLMIMLDVNTWIRFGVWMAVGLPMYLILIRNCTSSNKSIKIMHAKINGVKSNGYGHNYINRSDNEIRETRTRTPSPVLTYAVNNSLCSSLDVDNALAAFDEMLSKEDTKDLDGQSRRVSIDTVSNASDVNCEESIVALVHKDAERANSTMEFEEIAMVVKENDNHTIMNGSNTPVQTPVELVSDSVSEHRQSVPNIPPPPPMLAFEKFKTLRVRIKSVSQDDMLHNIQLHPFKPTQIQRATSQPEIIIKGPPSSDNIIEDVDDNIQFGSAQHQKIVGSLNKLFGGPTSQQLLITVEKPAVLRSISSPIFELNSNEASIVEKTGSPQNDDDNENTHTPIDIKEKLNKIFRSDPRLKLTTLTNPVESVDEEKCIPIELPNQANQVISPKAIGYIDLKALQENDNSATPNHINSSTPNDIDLHKKLMQNTLKSIKLRKIDSIANA